MKHLILFVCALFLTTSAVLAQDNSKLEDANYVILLNEQVFYYTKDGVTLLKEDLKLNNDTVVKTDGTYTTKEGKTLQLKDGECLGMSGKLYKDQATLTKKLKKELR